MKQATNPNQRVGIFVDVQNLYHSAKNLYGGRVNYGELIKYLVGGRQLIRAMAYVVKSEGIVEVAHREPSVRSGRGGRPVPLSSEASFFEALEKAGLELRVKDLQVFAGGMKKADWDVGMAVDAIRMASFLDVVILVTGDGDFIPLIDYLKWGVGRFVEVAAFKRSASLKVQEVADRFINIEEIPRIIIKR
ncbi:MAG: NYN domain-containing protein [Candidatus Liptonbacteria bacterium]|nr:NYN domain-containing protein [Candidatus Liptonbacteria bacterium]